MATTSTKVQERKEPEWLAELALTGGPVVRFRHVRPDDEPLITDAIRTASRETLLHRFFSPIRSVSPEMLRQMLVIDRAKETCIVGVTKEQGATRMVCGARYVKLPRPEAAEFAVTVHDDYQRRGLGRFLLKLLANLALAEGIRQFEADVMNSNQKMLNLFRKATKSRAGWHRTDDIHHVVLELSTLTNQESGLMP
jgi:RimJ/RimL family protein N-acetyltransferase